MSSVLRGTGFQSATQRPMVGDTKTSMVRADHLGWMLCDGRSLSQMEYRNLFAVLGTDFGSAGPGLFSLPNAQGRVMGLINQATENAPAVTDLSGWSDGDVSGEQTHTLTIAEIPAHNHDISGGDLNVSDGVDPSGNGRTSAELTGITLDPSGQHNHGGATGAGGWGTTAVNVNNLTTQLDVADNAGNHIHSISFDGLHSHTVIDPRHRHQIASNGGSLPHNNMQPTLFLGNLFIFSGRVAHNITQADGISTPTSNRNYYPPAQSRRLY